MRVSTFIESPSMKSRSKHSSSFCFFLSFVPFFHNTNTHAIARAAFLFCVYVCWLFVVVVRFVCWYGIAIGPKSFYVLLLTYCLDRITSSCMLQPCLVIHFIRFRYFPILIVFYGAWVRMLTSICPIANIIYICMLAAMRNVMVSMKQAFQEFFFIRRTIRMSHG